MKHRPVDPRPDRVAVKIVNLGTADLAIAAVESILTSDQSGLRAGTAALPSNFFRDQWRYVIRPLVLSGGGS